MYTHCHLAKKVLFVYILVHGVVHSGGVVCENTGEGGIQACVDGMTVALTFSVCTNTCIHNCIVWYFKVLYIFILLLHL